jgi:hypothetical protein
LYRVQHEREHHRTPARDGGNRSPQPSHETTSGGRGE